MNAEISSFFFRLMWKKKDELYSKTKIAYNLIQKERSNGNIKQTMYPNLEAIIEK